jgi:predicted PurR-regulated permease PerM
MATSSPQPAPTRAAADIAARDDRSLTAVWTRRFLIALTVLSWTILAGIALYVLGLIAGPITYLIISALIAYIFYPVVKRMERVMPRLVAILIVFLGLVVGLFVLMVAVVLSIVHQVAELIARVQQLFLPENLHRIQPVIDVLGKLGISYSQIQVSGQQIVSQLGGAARLLGGLVTSVIGIAIIALLIGTLAVYFLLDGQRLFAWLRRSAPLRYRARVNHYLDTVDGTLGHFVRGAVVLAGLMSLIMGVGAFLIGVPFALLLAVLVFVCAFVPIIGGYISGIFGCLLAFTQGWQTGLIMVVFVILVQGVLNGQILIPRVIGKAVGLHPTISIAALLIGFSLFGIIGAVLALPVVGVAQLLVAAWWKTWREEHPDQFPDAAAPTLAAVTTPTAHPGTDTPTAMPGEP